MPRFPFVAAEIPKSRAAPNHGQPQITGSPKSRAAPNHGQPQITDSPKSRTAPNHGQPQITDSLVWRLRRVDAWHAMAPS